jgi:hypothetical protein
MGHSSAFEQFVEKMCTSLIDAIEEYQIMFPSEAIVRHGVAKKLDMTHTIFLFQSTIFNIKETINSPNIELRRYVSENTVTCKGIPV